MVGVDGVLSDDEFSARMRFGEGVVDNGKHRLYFALSSNTLGLDIMS